MKAKKLGAKWILLSFLVICFVFISPRGAAQPSEDLLWPELQLPPIEWTKHIHPGITEVELISILRNTGVQYHQGPEGFTYSSMIHTDQRDYFFCEDKLYAIAEGGWISGAEFSKWFQTFLGAHLAYGQPRKYEADERWSRFVAEWKLEDGSRLLFILRSNVKDKQGWNRELYADDIGKTCIDRGSAILKR